LTILFVKDNIPGIKLGLLAKFLTGGSSTFEASGAIYCVFFVAIASNHAIDGVAAL
jgi:hypothetical protein